ncbi:hypothetical protein [Rhodopirellula bahusiensis]|uniref:hypothetical protein n=1 Tax=Rhodopirellula bahusiensis TaxID=2014065 RepID=UPI003265AA76
MSNTEGGFVQAKPSEADIDTVRRFFQHVEEYFEFGTLTIEDPEAEDESDDVTEEQILMHLREQWQDAGQSWRRVVESCDVLVRNCTDPDVTHLEWRPDLKAFLDGKYEERVDEEVKQLAAMIERRQKQIQQQKAAKVA